MNTTIDKQQQQQQQQPIILFLLQNEKLAMMTSKCTLKQNYLDSKELTANLYYFNILNLTNFGWPIDFKRFKL